MILALLVSACTTAVMTASFKTPEETFRTWKNAAERLDLETLVSCYAAATQPDLRREISANSSEGLKAMQRETQDTQFRIEKVVYEDHRAYLRVIRKRGAAEEVEIVNMIKEGMNWRLVP